MVKGGDGMGPIAPKMGNELNESKYLHSDFIHLPKFIAPAPWNLMSSKYIYECNAGTDLKC